MTLRVGVVGAGFVGSGHAGAYARQPDAQLVGIADVDLERAKQIANKYGAQAYRDVASLLAHGQPEAVSVCVPTGLHRSVAEQLAAAGVHVLLEKPMAATVPDCDEIIDACGRAQVTLMLGHTHRFHNELLEAKRLIDAGAIGTPMLALDAYSFGETGPWPAWYYDRELSGGGELMHDAVHLVDRLAWLIGSPIVEVFGRTTTYARGIDGVEDGGVVVLTFGSGAIASLFVNASTYPLGAGEASPAGPGRVDLEIHGSQGSILYRTWNELIIHLAGQPSRVMHRTDSDELVREVREFLDAIVERRAPTVGAADGRRSIAVIHAVYASERRGAPVVVDDLFPPLPSEQVAP